MSTENGHLMYRWISDLFPIARSLTGEGVRKTLSYIKSEIPGLEILSVKSGTKAFDWVIPNEWSINDAYIENLDGKKLISFSDSNLHVVGYSMPVNKVVSKEELMPYLHSLPELPNAIPYITSYYNETFGFCLSQNQKDSLGDGPFRIFVDSKLTPGVMNFGELYIPGLSEKEILFSTYICHPSMANNELSGPAVAMALAKHIQSMGIRKYSYRILFNVETIGAIYYLSKNLKNLKKNLVAGWVLTCLGDERNYSYMPTKHGNTFTDKVSRKVLSDLDIKLTEYSWLDRGSDERQYNAPGIDLPVASIMRSKYATYPEYHTSLDNLDLVSPKGLKDSLNALIKVVEVLETNEKWQTKVLGEPQLGRRGLYPTLSTRESSLIVRDLKNVLSFMDGCHDMLTIAEKCGLKYTEVLRIVEKLRESDVIDLKNSE